MLLKRRPVFETGPEGGKVESAVFPKLWLEIFFFLTFYYISYVRIGLINNVVIVSSAQKRDSAIHIHELWCW